MRGRDIAWLAELTGVTGLTPWCGKGFFLTKTYSADSLMVLVQPLCEITYINIYVHLQIPSIGIHMIVWIENAAYSVPILGDGMYLSM